MFICICHCSPGVFTTLHTFILARIICHFPAMFFPFLYVVWLACRDFLKAVYIIWLYPFSMRYSLASEARSTIRTSRPGSFSNEMHSICINWIFPTYLHPTEKFWKLSFPLFRRLFENSTLCIHKLSIENQRSLGAAVSKFPGQNILIYSFHTY